MFLLVLLLPLIALVACIFLFIVPMWKVFVRAGQPGWAILIPIYNFYVMLEVAKKPTWWLILCFVPGVNLVIFIMTVHGMVVCFGKTAGFTVGMILLPFIFIPMLGYGKDAYNPPAVPAA